ncbi:class I SAM-dependent methyltransferase [Sporolactobacillus sp. Y61]|jgi:putative AdoMet-dependent methyltransferase|uniref:Uncharacterized methyltransferase ABNN70_13085 n=1 Tax=Sporolactobacillus sp. Y61 TaxID=3160863 RepID=A0AAU8IE10_9BACL|nr:class I SAM-dependent methyltransferase [Sporolactobacillus sp. THM19-2]RYL94744.1 class I SAM-dependent methyltransferase [Sporolactobacillus sp. THM19-2]
MGREFIQAFNKWAVDYDRSVAGGLPEYHEVFQNYPEILEAVAGQARGTVLEFGVGTGNLTGKLLEKGLEVYGIEPSQKMREKAKEKLPNINLSDGDFIDFTPPDVPINSIVSSYAFHHLNHQEKSVALEKYRTLLTPQGRIVFADTLFGSEMERKRIELEAKRKGYYNLLKDLRTEYYPLRKELYEMFRMNHFVPYFKQMNEFVWMILAIKED